MIVTVFDLKKQDTFYAFTDSNRIEKFSFKGNKIFEIDDYCFSDGWGHRWYYKDYGKTWSFDKLDLFEIKYDDIRWKAEKFDNIERVLKNINLTPEEQDKLIMGYLYSFWGRLYGSSDKKYDAYNISCERNHAGAWINKNGDALVELIGMPGPDLAIYELEDYGKSWALTREELE